MQRSIQDQVLVFISSIYITKRQMPCCASQGNSS